MTPDSNYIDSKLENLNAAFDLTAIVALFVGIPSVIIYGITKKKAFMYVAVGIAGVMLLLLAYETIFLRDKNPSGANIPPFPINPKEGDKFSYKGNQYVYKCIQVECITTPCGGLCSWQLAAPAGSRPFASGGRVDGSNPVSTGGEFEKCDPEFTRPRIGIAPCPQYTKCGGSEYTLTSMTNTDCHYKWKVGAPMYYIADSPCVDGTKAYGYWYDFYRKENTGPTTYKCIYKNSGQLK